MKKRLLSILLAVVMLACMIPFAAVSSTAAETDAAETGGGALQITTSSYDAMISRGLYQPNKSFIYTPILRFGVQGGTGSYRYKWYYRESSPDGDYYFHQETTGPVLYVDQVGYYKCTVTDTETYRTVTTAPFHVENKKFPSFKYELKGTTLTWTESPLESQFDKAPGENNYYYYGIFLYRTDTTHHETHCTHELYVARTAAGEVFVKRDGPKSYKYGGFPTTYDPETHIYTMDMSYQINADKDFDDIEYSVYVEGVVSTTTYGYDGTNSQGTPRFTADVLGNKDNYGKTYFNWFDDGYGNTFKNTVWADHMGEVQIFEKDYTVGSVIEASLVGGRWQGYDDKVDITWQIEKNGQWKDVGTGKTYTVKSDDLCRKLRFYVQPNYKGRLNGTWHEEIYMPCERFVSNTIVVPAKITVNVTFTEPVAGAVASTDVSMTDNCGGKYIKLATNTVDHNGLDWMNETTHNYANHLPFEGGKTYSANVYFEAKDGYTVDASYLTVSFNGNWYVTVKNKGDSILATKNYTPIKPLASAGATVTAPSAGNTPDMAPVSLEPDKYSVEFQYWYNVTDGKRMTSSDKFETGKNYYIYLTFKPVNLNVFSDDTEYFINGKKAVLNGAGRNGNVRGYFNLGYNGPTVLLSQVNAQIKVPKAGEHPDFVPVPSDPTRYNVVVERWYKSGDYSNPMTSSDVFEAGKTYCVRLKFRGNDGYKVDYESTLTLVNGDQVTGGLYSYGSNAIGRVVSFKAEEAAKYWIGDVNADGAVKNRDALILDRYIAGWKDYDKQIKNWDAADMNRDGQIKNRDALMLDRYIAGWKDYQKYVFQVNG